VTHARTAHRYGHYQHRFRSFRPTDAIAASSVPSHRVAPPWRFTPFSRKRKCRPPNTVNYRRHADSAEKPAWKSLAVVRLWSMTGINRLVQAQGQQLLRMKGVLNLHDESRRLYFHSVHMLLDTTFGKAWQRDEARENHLVNDRTPSRCRPDA
jgi:G3E family GTPase